MGFSTTAAFRVGTGTTIAFTTAAFELRAITINGTDMTRASFDSSHTGTVGFKTKVFADLMGAGSLDIEGAFDPSLIGGMMAAMTAVADTLTVVWPDSSQVTGTGAVTSFSYTVPNEDVMTVSFTWEWDGETGPDYT